MKIILLALCLFNLLATNAQKKISGTFSPAEDYQWLIAYSQNPGSQNYIADTRIVNGQFTLNMPENSPPGTYRLVYAIPQEEFYFDVIYNGQEDIILHFTTEYGAAFEHSKENKIFNAYFRDISAKEQKIVDYYKTGTTESGLLKKLVAQLKQTQLNYEQTSKGLLANTFISSNAPYIPSGHESLEDYIRNKKAAYFSVLDISDPLLQASGYLEDKLANFVFTALPQESLEKSQTEQAIHQNIKTLNTQLSGTDDYFKTKLYHNLWKRAVALGYDTTSDHIYDSYLSSLAAKTGNQEINSAIDIHKRLRKGAVAPDIQWKTGNELKKLSTLEASQSYLLVFWSSTCSHCLNELPKLHAGLKENSSTKVLAIGLEDDELTWQQEAAKIPLFEHAISLGKWESEYANLYAIQQTPTYYVLDKDKKIMAQITDYESVLRFLNEQAQ